MPEERITRECNPSLSDLLSLPVFAGSRLTNESANLGALVSGVNLTDTPDYYNWISEGQLLVTTCYAIHKNKKAIAEFIPRLSKAALTGVCIKPSRFLGKTPDVMVSQALDLGFPLIELPSEVSFSEITKAVSDELLRRRTEMLRNSLAVNQMLTRTITEGATLREIADTVSGLTGGSTLIIDSVNDRRAYSLSSSDSALCRGRSADEICRLITGDVKPNRLSIGEKTFGLLYLCGEGVPGGIGDDLLDQVIQTIPLEISRESSVRESENRNFTEFFLHLLSDRIMDEAWEQSRAEAFGLKLSENHIIIRARIPVRSGAGESYSVLFQKAAFSHDLREMFKKLGADLRVIKIDKDYLLLASGIDKDSFPTLIHETDALLADHPSFAVAAGFSRLHSGISGLAQSDWEARVALKAAGARGKGVQRFDRLGILRLIYSENPASEASSFIAETLGDLSKPDFPHRDELLQTLTCYFRDFGNQRKIAEDMYLHYNTVVYRLKNIQKITGLDLRDPDNRMQMELALYLYNFGSHSVSLKLE